MAESYTACDRGLYRISTKSSAKLKIIVGVVDVAKVQNSTETTVIVGKRESGTALSGAYEYLTRRGSERTCSVTFLHILGGYSEDLLYSEDVIPLLSCELRYIKPAFNPRLSCTM